MQSSRVSSHIYLRKKEQYLPFLSLQKPLIILWLGSCKICHISPLIISSKAILLKLTNVSYPLSHPTNDNHMQSNEMLISQ